MTPAASTNLYNHHRFPGEIISHAVWLYFRFPLSHRDVAELLFARGIIVSYEAIRKLLKGSSPQSTRNGFSPHTVLLPNTFDRVGIVQPVAALMGATRQRECARDLAGGDFPQATALERPLDRLGSALHVMLFLENTLQTLFIFNGLRSRHCQRALLGYHYPRGSHPG
jgi:hypothetical protein